MPQHGRSAWTDDFSYLDAADQVAAAIAEHAGDEPVALVGHSMGGKIAMVLALRHPERVARLCVVDVAPVEYASGREFVGYVARDARPRPGRTGAPGRTPTPRSGRPCRTTWCARSCCRTCVARPNRPGGRGSRTSRSSTAGWTRSPGGRPRSWPA